MLTFTKKQKDDQEMIASSLENSKENPAFSFFSPTDDTAKIHAHEIAVAVVCAGLAVHNDPFYFAQSAWGIMAAGGYGVINAVALRLGHESGHYMADEMIESARKAYKTFNHDRRAKLCQAFRASCAVAFGSVTMLFTAPQTYDVMKKASQAVPTTYELHMEPSVPIKTDHRLVYAQPFPVLGWEG